MQKVLEFINNNVKNNDTVVVACSYGPDSMALLNILANDKLKNLKIIVAHVNHNVRQESKIEEENLKKYCLKNNLIFESMKIKKINNNNFEMEARKIRYNFFEKLVKKYHAKILFTAHHGDDLIETILMRLNRGSTLKGYKGIELITNKKDYQIMRPLLYTTKKEILDYLEKNKILYAIDYTNFDDIHTRNRFRKNVLPFLKEENPNVHEKYLEYSKELKEYDNFVEKYLDNKCKHILKNNIIIIDKFLKEDILIQKKLLERLLEKIYDGYLEVINKKHVENIRNLIIRNRNNSIINLPGALIGLIEYNQFKIIKEIPSKEYDYVFKNYLKIDNKEFKEINENLEKSNYILRINSKDVELPFHVRTRINGDKILLKNAKYYKKVSDILTDDKINYEHRQNLTIFTDNSGKILWIPGVKKSNFDKEKNEKYDIIIKYILNKEENNE